MTRSGRVITTYFGNAFQIAIESSNDDVALRDSIFKALVYFQLELGTYGGSKKTALALEHIAEAIATSNPIIYFIPMCLRYYYDFTGEQQILPDLETHLLPNISGMTQIKDGVDFKRNIIEDLNRVQILRSLGVPIKIVMPVMDHEVLRPERMNTELNRAKISEYTGSISEFLKSAGIDVSLRSSLQLFGVPKDHPAFQEMLADIRESSQRMYYGGSKFGISERTFEHTVNEEHKRNFEDPERNPYYRSREFARLCREYDFGEARVHAVEMSKLALENKYTGCFIKLPRGAEIDMFVFNTEEGVIVTFDK